MTSGRSTFGELHPPLQLVHTGIGFPPALQRGIAEPVATQDRGGLPNEEAAPKLLFLALRQATKKWTMPIHHWQEALNHFTILWPERMPGLERITQ